MTVFVDDMFAKYGRMKMCHMVADSHKELMDMAKLIGVNNKWVQHQGSYKEHFDICAAKMMLAIEYGAEQITTRELGKIIYKRKSLHK